MNEIYEYRTTVECAAAELAARKGADAEVLSELIRLAEISYRTDSRENYMQFIEADTAFHMDIARLSRNQMLMRAVGEARCYMEQTGCFSLTAGQTVRSARAECCRHNAKLELSLRSPIHRHLSPLRGYLTAVQRDFPHHLFQNLRERSSTFPAQLHPAISHKENHATRLAYLAEQQETT